MKDFCYTELQSRLCFLKLLWREYFQQTVKFYGADTVAYVNRFHKHCSLLTSKDVLLGVDLLQLVWSALVAK